MGMCLVFLQNCANTGDSRGEPLGTVVVVVVVAVLVVLYSRPRRRRRRRRYCLHHRLLRHVELCHGNH